MAVTTISWGDGSGDNLYLTYPSASGDQTVQVSSDANTGAARSKVVSFATGNITRQLTVNQDAGSSGRLPAGYTEYDYLQSSGNVQLKTGITGAYTWYLTAQCSSPGSGSQILIGDRTNGGCWIGQASSKWGLGSTSNTTVASSTKSDLVVTFASNKTTLTIGNVTVERSRSMGFAEIQLFGPGSYYFIGSVFGDVIAKNGDSEVFHGIPCTNQNNVAGYYDTVSQSFIAPYRGTLTAGNE